MSLPHFIILVKRVVILSCSNLLAHRSLRHAICASVHQIWVFLSSMLPKIVTQSSKATYVRRLNVMQTPCMPGSRVSKFHDLVWQSSWPM